MAKKQSTISTASPEPTKEGPKVFANLEAQKIILEVQASLGRFSKMMDGLNTFCYSTDEGGAVYEFSNAVGTIADLIKDDAESIRQKIGKILICPEGVAK